jgi:tetratricopeptide (TPR) repeat protein
MALHAGEVHYDDHGVAGVSVNLAFRLLDAAGLRNALSRSTGVLALITSSWFFDEVVQHSLANNRSAYYRTRVETKETNTVGWIFLPDDSRPPHPVHPAAPPETAETRRFLVPQQLPAHTPYFVGRERELAQLTRSLDVAGQESGTVIITAIDGTAGIGKTALALHWAHRAKDRFPDGQLHINLRGFDLRAPINPGDALNSFLHSLGIDPQAIPTDLDAQAALYRSVLAGRRVLVLLDNARSSDQVRPLLPGSPACAVIVTSRNRMEGLTITEGAHRVTLDVLPADEAIALLAKRIGHHQMDAEPDATVELVNLCARLPLALNIAAARAAPHPDFLVSQLVEELRHERDRLNGLDLGDTEVNLRAVFSWSYNVLTTDAARMFRLLGLHPGPDIDRQACAAIAGKPPEQAEAVVRELRNAHLIEEHTPNRFRFHDLLRAYATERAEHEEPAPSRTNAIQRLLDHYLHTSLAANQRIDPSRPPIIGSDPNSDAPVLPFPDYDSAWHWCDTEHNVLITTVDYAHNHGWHRHCWQLAWVIAVFLQRRGLWHHYATTQAIATRAANQLHDKQAYATATRHLANAHVRIGNYVQARKYAEQALTTAREIGDLYGQARSHHVLATSYNWEGSHSDAHDHYLQAIVLFREIDHRGGQADTLSWLGRTHSQLGDYNQAIHCCQLALTLCREVDDHHAEATYLDSLGYAYHHLGSYDEAIHHYQESLALFHRLGDHYYEATTLIHLADTHRAMRDHQPARQALLDALAILERLRHPLEEHVRSALTELN